MAVRRAIIGPRAVITEDIRTSSKNLNCQVINAHSSIDGRKLTLEKAAEFTNGKRPGVPTEADARLRWVVTPQAAGVLADIP